MAATDGGTSLMREKARAYVGRWTGARTFVVAAAAVFLALIFTGALDVWPAIFAFVILAGIVLLRGLLTGEAVALRTVPAEPVSAAVLLGSGASLTILNELPDPLIVLDGTGRVTMKNRAAELLIGQGAVGKHVATVLRSAPLVTAIEDVLRGGNARSVEYSVPVPVERHYDAFISPVEMDVPAPTAAGDPLRRRKGRPVLVLLRDVTEMRRVEAMRVDFIANASHELKTPLASLSGFIDTLRGHAKDDPEAQLRFLEIMADQAGRMRRLIEDLLSLSRIELREHVRPDQAVDLFGVVSDVTDGLTPLAEQNGVEIAVTAPANLPRVRGDRDELAQVIQNLADNALRYGRAGKRVEIALAPDARAGKPMVRLSVRDFGPGIAREHLPRLTERFYRVDAAQSRAKGGTGLGLAIVKHIVNRHEGTLAIDSELGQGSVFTVLIPAVGGS